MSWDVRNDSVDPSTLSVMHDLFILLRSLMFAISQIVTKNSLEATISISICAYISAMQRKQPELSILKPKT